MLVDVHSDPRNLLTPIITRTEERNQFGHQVPEISSTLILVVTHISYIWQVPWTQELVSKLKRQTYVMKAIAQQKAWCVQTAELVKAQWCIKDLCILDMFGKSF